MKKILLLTLLLAGTLGAEEIKVSFAKDQWDKTKWMNVKSPRWPDQNEFAQFADHIMNKCPDELNDEQLFKYDHKKIYASLVYKRRFGGKTEIASVMSFDHRMAPLIVIAPEVAVDPDGRTEFREHYEVVLYDQGLNIWHHMMKDGKPVWHKAAWLSTTFKPKTKYDLKVTLEKRKTGAGEIMQITARVGDLELGLQDPDLPETFYAGITGCEGRNRFYDFRVKSGR